MTRRVVCVALCIVACSDDPAAPASPNVAAVVVSPGSAGLYPSNTMQLTAVVTDSLGDTLTGHAIVWSTSNPLIATVDTNGLVTATGGGTALITATSEGLSDSASIAVRVANTLTVTPARLTIVPGGLTRLQFVALDSAGDTLPGYPFMLASSDTAVAAVTATGLVTGRATGTATVTATSLALLAQVTFSVRTVTFTAVEASEWQTGCGITTDSAAFCWAGPFGQGAGLRDASATPVGVALAEKASHVTAGDGFACALTVNGSAYCWGSNSAGRLGIGTGAPLHLALMPLPVSGGHTFTAISSGWRHTCALASAGEAWCWGSNELGALGIGSAGTIMSSPVPVAGGLQFQTVSAGGYNTTCAIAVDSTAYCWGWNEFGQVGSGDSAAAIAVPRLVAGGMKFWAVSAGWTHSCGITVSGAAYCWGNNLQGELGTGDTMSSRVPRAVAGGLTFVDIAEGGSGVGEFTCALAASGAIYCWGDNLLGQLGNGTTDASIYPTPIMGMGKAFTRITAGEDAACAIATSGRTFCWGWGVALGTTSMLSSAVPVEVAGQP